MASRMIPVHLRWGDMDAFGHVNNVAFVQYLEDARVSFLAQAGYTPVIDGFAQIVAHHEVDYLGQLAYRDTPVPCEVWVDSIRNSSYVIGYEMRDEDKVYLRAKTTLVCFDFENSRPVRIPAHYRADLETATRD